MKTIIVLLVLTALAAGGVYGYRKWLSPPAETSFKTVEVKRSTIVSTVSATGTVEPVVKVLVGSQVSGTVMRWYADFNQRVEQGFVLLELDQDRFKATLSQRTAALAVSKARVEEAAAKLANATLERERLERASMNSAASDFEVRTARSTELEAIAALHAAEAQVEAAEADRRLAEIELDKTVIRAPIDGVVISRDIDAGQTVAASLSAPTLFTIANDLTKMRVNAAVSETDIGRIKEGMPADFRVDAYPTRRFRGTVSQVRFAETVVDNVVTYTTLIDVENPDMALRPGMTATILFEVAKAEDVLVVSNAALRFDPKSTSAPVDWSRPGKGRSVKSRVYRLDGTKDLVEVQLDLGLTDGTVTEVKSGEIEAGQLIVTDQEGGAGRGAPRSAVPPRMPRMM